MVFVIHWHESAMDVHVFPIPIPPERKVMSLRRTAEKCAFLLIRFSRIQLVATLWTTACQAPLSMGILQVRILEWIAMPSSRGIFPIQGWNPRLFCLLLRQAGSSPLQPRGKPSWEASLERRAVSVRLSTATRGCQSPRLGSLKSHLFMRWGEFLARSEAKTIDCKNAAQSDFVERSGIWDWWWHPIQWWSIGAQDWGRSREQSPCIKWATMR